MFTGIIKELGVVQGMNRLGRLYRLEVSSKDIFKSAAIGDSVAIDGVCLTLIEKGRGLLSFDIMEETVKKSNLGGLKNGDRVNLEGSLRAGDSLGGHFVSGHIDCAGRIKTLKYAGDESYMDIEFPKEFSALVVEKGSIAIDGISLTVGEVTGNVVKIYLIPHTLKTTTLGAKKAGDAINIEFDILGKYIAHFAGSMGAGSGITEEFLKNSGFNL